MPIIGLAVVALALIVGIFFYFIGEEKKQDQQQIAQREKAAQAEREAKEEEENRAKKNDVLVKKAERRAKDAEHKLKQAIEKKAQAEANRKAAADKAAADKAAADKAAADKAAADKAAADKAAADKAAADKAAADKAAADKAAVEQKAAEEAKRKAQELRDNPDKLLESKGFKKKGTKWVFAQEEKLKQVTSDLTKSWRDWKKLTPKNDAGIKKKLEIYNKLLLDTIEIGAMRQAVSGDFHQALDDPEVGCRPSRNSDVKDNRTQ